MEGFLSGLRGALLFAFFGVLGGALWGIEASELPWGGFDNNAKITASAFVHALVGLVVSTSAFCCWAVALSLFVTVRAAPLFGIPLLGVVGLLWWKGLSLGNDIAQNVNLHEASLLTQLALTPIWLFCLLLPTFLLNLLAALFTARRNPNSTDP